MTLRLACLALALAAAVPAARSEDACLADVKRLCPDVKPVGGRVDACLREHAEELSAPCRERRQADEAAARRIIQEFGRACKADVAAFCGGIEAGQGRIIGCLSQHQPELTAPCESQITRYAEAKSRVAALKAACKADAERLCEGVRPEAGALVECLQERRAELSAGCNVSDVRLAQEAATLVDVVEKATRQDRIRESLEILLGADTVAFSRSQVLVQLDNFERLLGKANGVRFLVNPQFVFGDSGEFALQVKVPLSVLSPAGPSTPVLFGLGDVSAAFGWNFLAHGQMRHFAAVALQVPTAAQPPLGAAWAVTPAYAFAMGLARWVSFTVQLSWTRSFGSSGYPTIDLLQVEPVVVFNLPGRYFLLLDTRLGWSFADGAFLPLMKGVAGLFTDRQRTLSLSAWFQAPLTASAVSHTFQYNVGLATAWFFQ